MTSDVYGRLVVLHEARKRGSHRYVLCRCACGVVKEIRLSHLKNGSIVSCGCYRYDLNTTGRTGLPEKVSGTRIYKCWTSMKERCYNKNASRVYPHYGGRGIKVCSEWKETFWVFREWAIANGYNDDLTLDRIDPDCDYTPSNCRWVTKSLNTQFMLSHNYSCGTGQFTKDVIDKITETNRVELGAKFRMLRNGIDVAEFRCLVEAAEFIKTEKNLSTDAKQIKKNISACLHGKRHTCHGYSFIFKENE